MNILLCLSVCILVWYKALHNPSIKLHIKSFQIFVKAKSVIVSLIPSRKIIIYTNVKSQVKLTITNVQVVFFIFISFKLIVIYFNILSQITSFYSVFFTLQNNRKFYCQYLMEIILLYLFKLNIECWSILLSCEQK